MWVGTSGSGLNLCEPEDNYRSLKYEHYGTSEGLVNDVIQSILGDNNGNLWVATEYGIYYVNADQFINKLDHGLDEPVRERGNNFSAGQRQLLSFARTIIHKPSVMILDEATANIDTETELLIQDSMEKMKNIGTMLIVAHRLSTIQHADEIIVLSHGKIVEHGTHQELLAAQGRYYQLYTLQYHREQSEKKYMVSNYNTGASGTCS